MYHHISINEFVNLKNYNYNSVSAGIAGRSVGRSRGRGAARGRPSAILMTWSDEEARRVFELRISKCELRIVNFEMCADGTVPKRMMGARSRYISLQAVTYRYCTLPERMMGTQP